jgi:hypothetical protein
MPMRSRCAILLLSIAAPLIRAADISDISITFFGPGFVGFGDTAAPVFGNGSANGWDFTGSLTNNLVKDPTGGWDIPGALVVRLTDVDMLCNGLRGCGAANIDYSATFHFIDSFGSKLLPMDIAINGSGPAANATFEIQYGAGFGNFSFDSLGAAGLPKGIYNFNDTLSGPPIINGTFLTLSGSFNVPAGNYTVGTGVHLPGSFDVTLGTAPEPTTLAFVAGVVGLLGWRVARCRK